MVDPTGVSPAARGPRRERAKRRMIGFSTSVNVAHASSRLTPNSNATTANATGVL